MSVDKRGCDESAAHARYNSPSDAVAAFKLDIAFCAAAECVGSIVGDMTHDSLAGIFGRDGVAAWYCGFGPARVISIGIQTGFDNSFCLWSTISLDLDTIF